MFYLFGQAFRVRVRVRFWTKKIKSWNYFPVLLRQGPFGICELVLTQKHYITTPKRTLSVYVHNLIKFHTLWEGSHFSGDCLRWTNLHVWRSRICVALTVTTQMYHVGAFATALKPVGFNAHQCPFRTNVNQTFCPAQPKLMKHFEKLIGPCPRSDALHHHRSCLSKWTFQNGLTFLF